jgi:hypothetical protein
VKIPGLVLTTALLLSLSACGGSDEPKAKPSAPTSALVTAPVVGTVEGRLLEVGGPSGTEDTPVAGRLSITGSDGAVVHADIGDDARYAIQLPPGQYVVTATSPGYLGGTGECQTDPATTVIVADKTVTADVLCQRD